MAGKAFNSKRGKARARYGFYEASPGKGEIRVCVMDDDVPVFENLKVLLILNGKNEAEFWMDIARRYEATWGHLVRGKQLVSKKRMLELAAEKIGSRPKDKDLDNWMTRGVWVQGVDYWPYKIRRLGRVLFDWARLEKFFEIMAEKGEADYSWAARAFPGKPGRVRSLGNDEISGLPENFVTGSGEKRRRRRKDVGKRPMRPFEG